MKITTKVASRFAYAAALMGLLLACSSTQFSSNTHTKALVPPPAAGPAPLLSPAPVPAPTPATSDSDKKPTPAAAVATGTAAVPSAPAPAAPAPLPVPPPPPNIDFGLLVNDLNCTFCHLEVHSTVVSVTTVPPFRSDSHGEVFGQWLINGLYNAPAGLQNPPKDGGIVVSSGVTPNYNNSGGELPVSSATAGAAGSVVFPMINFTSLATSVQGQLTASAGISAPLSIKQVYAGNVVLVGTAAQPITVSKDILIQGDLVITGYYTGVGTIYVTGNIYIPANLQALHLASFPYSDDPVTANAQAQADLAAGNKDALGLASAKNIFVGDLENYMDSTNGTKDINGNATGTGAEGQRYVSVYEAQTGEDPLMLRVNNGIENVYTWLPETTYQTLYTTLTPCWTTSNRTLVPGHHWGEREFSEIDAYLYAALAIGGVDRALNWTINGGMIAQVMHIVSGAGYDSVAATPCAASRINFDYRMKNGLQVLEALAGYFPATANMSGTTGNGSGTSGNGSGTGGNGSGT